MTRGVFTGISISCNTCDDKQQRSSEAPAFGREGGGSRLPAVGRILPTYDPRARWQPTIISTAAGRQDDKQHRQT